MKFLHFFAIGLLFCMTIHAQGNRTFRITGRLTQDSLRFTTTKIHKIYLQSEVDGKTVILDSAIVSKRQFHFEGQAPRHLEMCYLAGFDNGSIALFLEPGHITVSPFDSRFPAAATLGGTPNNDILGKYQKLIERQAQTGRDSMQHTLETLPNDMRTNELKRAPYQRTAYYANSLYHMTQIMRFAMDHIHTEAALFIIDHDLFNVFTPKVVERQLLRAVPAGLHNTPIYQQMTKKLRQAKQGKTSPSTSTSATTEDKLNKPAVNK